MNPDKAKEMLSAIPSNMLGAKPEKEKPKPNFAKLKAARKKK